jgi:hypothetical protein
MDSLLGLSEASDLSMHTVCPNCARSYGVEVAISPSPRGWTRQARCHCCHWVWQVDLSGADKLMLVADAVAPAREAIDATAQAAGDARIAALRFERRSTPAFEKFEPAKIAQARANLPGSIQVKPSSGPYVATEFLRDAPALIDASRAWWSKSWRLPPSYLQIAILGLVIADAAIIGWRADLVRAMPQTATFYARLGLPVNIRGLTFDSVAATTEWRGGEPVLVVNGKISNDTSTAEEVPRLHLVARNSEHQQIYSWATASARQALAPGETMPFRSELALPPPDTREIMVRFADRNDSL